MWLRHGSKQRAVGNALSGFPPSSRDQHGQEQLSPAPLPEDPEMPQGMRVPSQHPPSERSTPASLILKKPWETGSSVTQPLARR